MPARLEEFMAGGYRALLRLRDEGVIAGFGAGLNEGEPCDRPLERGEFDIFLQTGRFTLLEQGALGFMDRAAGLQAVCAAHGVQLVDAAF
jgi:D-threo-aldose 1-dehydrogenase